MPPQAPAVNQRIFQMGLSVETVSAYLLICGLADGGQPLTFETLLDKWNGIPADLQTSLETLQNKNIVRIRQEPEPVYELTDPHEWRE